MFFFGFLFAPPNIVPSPLNRLLAIESTLLMFVFSATYFARTWFKPTTVTEAKLEGVIESRPFIIEEWWERTQYQNKVKRDLVKIRLQLNEIDHPKDIQFHSWNRGVDHRRKPWLIGDDRIATAIQRFPDALNERNDYVRENGVLNSRDHPEFMRLNQECINWYEQVRALGFIE